ncbi:MAG: ABC transporter ATP-binding protein, partial [Acidobacteriota bacterium]
VEKDKIWLRVDEAKRRCGLEEQGHRLIKHLSKGFRQRVGLAQALIHKPEVLILDEPTAGLDPHQIIEVRNLIKSLGGDHTVILSTHVLPEVSMTCGRVIILNRGRIAAEGSPSELTASLRKDVQVQLEVAGPVERLPAILQELPGVRQASLGEALNGHWPLTVETDGDVDVRAALARTVVEAGCDLLQLQRQTMSLEEIFLALTTEEAPSQQYAAAQQQEMPGAIEEGKEPTSAPTEETTQAEKQEEQE